MQMTLTEQQVNVAGFRDGLAIEYLTAGHGPPLVLLHGVGDSAHSWSGVMPTLARTHRVFAPSLPGFGRSAKPVADYSPAFFTAVIARFLDTLGLEEVTVVGNSLGGLIAMRLALAMPSRVAALGLVDSAGLGREITLAMRLLTRPSIGKIVAAWHKTALGSWQWAVSVAALLFAHPTRVPRPWLDQVHRFARLPGYFEATVATVRSGSTLRGQREREIMLAALPELQLPTLVIWGSRDRVVPVRHAHAAVARLPHGHLAVIPDCGHLPHVERPDHFAAVLGQFLTEHVMVPR